MFPRPLAPRSCLFGISLVEGSTCLLTAAVPSHATLKRNHNPLSLISPHMLHTRQLHTYSRLYMKLEETEVCVTMLLVSPSF